MGIVLKPCPFCGASDPMLIDSIAARRWRVDCQGCTASVSTAFKDSAIGLWNKRAAQEVDAPADPFLPDAEVRAALRMWFGEQLVPGSKIAAWVTSWPDTA